MSCNFSLKQITPKSPTKQFHHSQKKNRTPRNYLIVILMGSTSDTVMGETADAGHLAYK